MPHLSKACRYACFTMALDLNSDDIRSIRAELGPLLGELLQVMLDVDAFPSCLLSDERPRLVHACKNAVDRLGLWVLREPEVTAEIFARLPDLVRGRSVSESMLEAVTWSGFFGPSISLFDRPSPDSRVFAAAPPLFKLLDESGLVAIDGLDARPWGLHFGDYAFHYHQLLRRSFGSRIHYGLVSTLLRTADNHNLTIRVALDERRLQFRDEYEEFHEADYWYGPPLSESALDDLAAVGETFHGDPDGGTSMLNPYAGLSVRWTASGPLKTVEIEEFMPIEANTDWVFARYLHAIRDTAKRTFVHCDGAVKAYDAKRYPRAQRDFRHRGRGDLYRKLFRIDGEFPAAAWSELASSWFRGNRQIYEYLDSPKR